MRVLGVTSALGRRRGLSVAIGLMLAANLSLVNIGAAHAVTTCTFTGRGLNILAITVAAGEGVSISPNGPGTLNVSYPNQISGCGIYTSGSAENQVAGISIVGADGTNEYVGVYGPGDAVWDLPNGIAIDLGTDGAGYPDNVSFQGDSTAETIDVGAFASYAGVEVAYVLGGAGNDTIVGASGLRNQLAGGEGDDTITGGKLSDQICGEEGVDVLDGLVGDDRLFGGPGTDQVFGGAGSDLIGEGFEDADPVIGAACVSPYDYSSSDVIDGGRGSDTVDYNGHLDSLASTAAVTVSLATGQGGTIGSAEVDLLSGLENVRGTALGDTLTGDGGPNVLEGGGTGDTLLGGDGVDTLSYEHSASAVQVSLPLPLSAGSCPPCGGDANGDGGSGFENILGSVYGDSLTGDVNANIIWGGPVGSGMAGDTISGSEGADTIYGSPGTDTLNGDAGKDVIYGGDAGDNLFGGAGADKLYGQIGNDTLDGGTERDLADGGADTDTCTAERAVACEVIPV